MKQAVYFFIFFLYLFQAGLLPAENLPHPFRVLPEPQKTELLPGKGIAYGDIGYLVLKGHFHRPVMGSILSQLPETKIPAKGSLILIPDSSAAMPASPEGYVLTISGGNAEIRSRGEAGLFYGCQTLEQILEDARDFHVPVPACRITDYPALAYRAVHFDVKHHLDHINYYYNSIDRLARYKINAVIFEFEDKLRYRRQPLIGAPQAISISEMAALTRYARERHIEISPLVQGLGHATFILKHKEYAPLRELPNNRWAFCPLDSGTYRVLFDMYLDAMEATPGSRYLHVGGDEIGNIGLCPRCKPMADKEGLMALNLYWLNKVSSFIQAHGRTPIFWDDMPLKEAGVYKITYDSSIDSSEAAHIWKQGEPKLERVLGTLPPGIVFMRWNYSMARQPGNIMVMDWYEHHHLQTMVATAAQSGPAALFPFDERERGMSSRGIAAIRSFVSLGAEKKADGMLCTAWDDRSPHMETYWRGFIASAEYSWNPAGRSLKEFDPAYLQREYGTTCRNYVSVYAMLRKAAVCWERAFYRKGGRMDLSNTLFNLPGIAHWAPPKKTKEPAKTDFTNLLIELPDRQKPGAWSKKYKARLLTASSVLQDYAVTSQKLDSLYRSAKRNRYHWELFSAINDFQITAPRLLLALQQCDTPGKTARKEGIRKVRQALAEFDKAWSNLQKVYAETRFLSYPPDYVPDRYFHFASQREDLSWMIQSEELFHRMIRSWLNEEKHSIH